MREDQNDTLTKKVTVPQNERQNGPTDRQARHTCSQGGKFHAAEGLPPSE